MFFECLSHDLFFVDEEEKCIPEHLRSLQSHKLVSGKLFSEDTNLQNFDTLSTLDPRC